MDRIVAGSQGLLTIAVYADVNPNLIDGSTIWLQSVCLCCAGLPARVVVVTRDRVSNDVVLGPVVEAGGEVRSIADLLGQGEKQGPQAAAPSDVELALEKLDREMRVDLFLVRGENHLVRLAKNLRLRERVWGYWLRRPAVKAPWLDEDLLGVAAGLGRILVQSEQIKSVLESMYWIPAGKVVALPPMVPPEAWKVAPLRTGAVNLVYSGKMDKLYNVEKYLSLPTALQLYNVDCTVTFIGDKFNTAKEDSGFVRRMRAALEDRDTVGVEWRRGMRRQDALGLMAEGLFGLCWRDPRYDQSLELSTKLLEFCALGVPPLVNRTDVHVALLGKDYPYFVSSANDIVAAVIDAREFPEKHNAVRQRIRSLVTKFSFESMQQRLGEEIQIAGVGRRSRSRAAQAPRRRVLIAGHDLKFLDGVLDRIEASSDVEIRHDRWFGTSKHDERASERHLEWAESIFCEWCTGAAVWYSTRLKDDQKCFVRLHRFEAFEDFPRKVDFSKVHRAIVVSDYFRDLCAREFGWDAAKIDVLPQYVDWRQLNRPKHPWADYTLGLVGINSFPHKRFDRAIDILQELRAADRRWRLRIRSVMPWELDWFWKRPANKQGFQIQFSRITSDPDLRDNIIFDPPGPDMAEWYRQVGFILSTSDSEGCHTSVAEGMASGAVPVIYAWPGAQSVYPREYVFDSVPGMVAALRRYEDPYRLGAERDRVSTLARAYDIEVSRRHIESLLLS